MLVPQARHTVKVIQYVCCTLYPKFVICIGGCRTTFDVAFTFEERVMEQLVEGILSYFALPFPLLLLHFCIGKHQRTLVEA